MKKHNAMNKYGALLGFFALILALQRCAEPKTGCLDIRATNFQVDADETCTDCCTYPELRLDLLHKFTAGDSLLNFIPGNTYPSASGSAFRLGDLRYYLSEIHLLRTNGEPLLLNGQLTLRKANPAGDSNRIIVEDNFALATPASLLRIRPGTFKDGGTFTGVKFKVGISEPARSGDPGSAPAAHPLRPQSIPMWTQPQGYLSQRIEVFTGIPPADTIRRLIEFGGPTSVREITLPFNQPVTVPPGFNVTLTFRIDYARWLYNIHFSADTDAGIIRKLEENLPFSFSVTSVSASSN